MTTTGQGARTFSILLPTAVPRPTTRSDFSRTQDGSQNILAHITKTGSTHWKSTQAVVVVVAAAAAEVALAVVASSPSDC